MKTKIAWSVAAIVAVTLLLIARPFAVMEKIAQPKSELPFPLNHECVVTIENEAWVRNVRFQAPGPASGLLPDFTVQGKLVALSPEWVVIGEGSYENWISRDRIVNIRVSR